MVFLRFSWLAGALLLLTTCGAPEVSSDFLVVKSEIAMPDGVQLAVTYYVPKANDLDAKFPVLFEMLPYRKDDFFYARDYPIYSDFVRKGFLMAKVDVRGTGSSEGVVPEREYSAQEIEDAVFIIDYLSKLPHSNGKVGMWGLSWGGFNALQVRARKPPALKAVLAIHASDDLFHDDIRYIDGILHLDSYAVEIDADVALPRSPNYPIDEAYRTERFEREPWIFTYLKHQRDSKFWRERSVRYDQSSNDIPLYLIGGLLDGYRDSVLRLFETQASFVQAEIGPWGHDFPNEGSPGPNYEWRDRAAAFWNRWLGSNTVPSSEKNLIVYIRNADLWKKISWPSVHSQFFLSSEAALASVPARHNIQVSHQPSQGVAAGLWWGDPTADLAAEDRHCATFDSPRLSSPREVVGFAQVSFQAKTNLAHLAWVARLEDVSPEGQVALVTGGALNSSQRHSRLAPTRLVPHLPEAFVVPLHFTTWVFPAGHRIRLSVCLGQFPMFWPMPNRGTAEILLDENSFLRLPAVPQGKAVLMDSPRDIIEAPDIEILRLEEPTVEVRRDEKTGKTSVMTHEGTRFRRGDDQFSSQLRVLYETRNFAPEQSHFHGTAEREINLQQRKIKFQSEVTVTSDETHFRVRLRRQLWVNSHLELQRIWEEKIPRDFQ